VVDHTGRNDENVTKQPVQQRATQEDGNHLEKRSAERDAEGRIQTQVVDELEDSTTQLELDNGTEIVCGVNSIGTDKAKSN